MLTALDERQATLFPRSEKMEKALENKVVLSTLFKCFSFEQLRTVRLVSKLWLQESLPTWRRRAVVRIGAAKMIGVHHRQEKRHEKNSGYYKKVTVGGDENKTGVEGEICLDKFLDYVADPASSGTLKAPFQNFIVSHDTCFLPSRFWEVCGPHIKYLEVVSYSPRHCAELRDILLGPRTPVLETVVLESHFLFRKEVVDAHFPHFDFGKKSAPSYVQKPKVKSMKFLWCDTRKDGDDMSLDEIESARCQLPFTLKEMFGCFINLEKVDIFLNDGYLRMDTKLLPPLLAIKEFRKQGMLGKLQHLALSRGEGEYDYDDGAKEMLKFLGEVGIALQSLKLVIGTNVRNTRDTIPEVEYYPRLDKHKDSLTFLDIAKVRTPYAGLFQPGMIFPWLETLVISSEQCGKKMEFLKNTPNLKSLHVLGYVFGNRDSRFVPICNGREIVEEEATRKAYLSFGENMTETGDEDLAICSNLKELICNKVCTLQELHLMARRMPNLEALELPMENCALQLVCHKWTKLQRLTVLKHPLGEVTDAGVIGCWDSPWPDVPPASIKDLTDLRFLKLNSRKDTPFLTFLSLSLGIFQLPRLAHLEIDAKLSELQMEELFRRVPSCVLLTKNMTPGIWRRFTNIWRD